MPCRSQTGYGSSYYSIEALGSAATDDHTPFWMVSNKYGAIPLDAGNAYLRAGVFHHQSYQNGLHWNAGVDLLAVTPRYRNVYIQQLYAEIKYKCLKLTVGSKENYTSLWDKELSSGDMVFSANARPIPEINLSVPHFTTVPFTKKRMQFRANFAVGRSFEDDYIQQFINEKQNYIQNPLWHHKSLHIRILDPYNRFPFTAIIGVRHHAQWGGVSTDPEKGSQPHSLKDFVRIIAGKSGGENALAGDRQNVLGNHYGAYDFKLGYFHPAFAIHLYRQHYFDDTSGMELYNLPDGLYGVQADLLIFSWINKIVLEFLCTRNQSGPIHYIMYDHREHPGFGGGRDNYYNNDEYTTGSSYFNRSIGSPLLTSPEYNKNGDLGFKNNRIRAFHLGFQGYLSRQVSYRILATSSESWGTMDKPFLKKAKNFSCAAKLSYCHPRLESWLFSGEIGADFGSTYGDNTGISLSVKKTGILKRWH